MDSNLEVPVAELSGDENEEKMFMKSTIIFSMSSDHSKKKYNSFNASIGVMKTIVGSGILGLPFVMSNFGLIPGILIFTMVYGATYYTCLLLLKSKNICRHSNLSTIGKAAIGPSARILISITVIVNNIGICMAEIAIFGASTTRIVTAISDNY